MGNVLAASNTNVNQDAAKFALPELGKPTKASAGNVAPPPLPTAAANAGVDSKASGTEYKYENPGTVEEIHKKCKEVHPMPFEGARFMLNKGLSNHFQVSHTIHMSSVQPSSYRFGATYVGTKQFSLTEAFPVLLGDIDPNGNLNANVIHQFTPRVRCKFAAQIQESKMVAIQGSTEYRGRDFTAAVTVGNPNFINNSGVIVGHYLQTVMPKVALGAELAYQFGPNVPGGQIAIVSAVGRITNENSVWSATLGAGGAHICYWQRASEQLQIGVEVETSSRMQESVATIGYQIDLPKADLTFKGSFDSNWNVCGVLEKRLMPLPFSFALSGRMNHNKNQFRLGCGLIIG